MLLRIIKSYRDVVAICDKKLLGKRFEEGKFQLDLTGEFFKGKEVSQEEAIEIIQDMSIEDSTFNIIGEKSTTTAIKAGIISEEGIKKIQGIPFALVLM